MFKKKNEFHYYVSFFSFLLKNMFCVNGSQWAVQCDSQTNDSYELVHFSESTTYIVTSLEGFLNEWLKWVFIFLWIKLYVFLL